MVISIRITNVYNVTKTAPHVQKAVKNVQVAKKVGNC